MKSTRLFLLFITLITLHAPLYPAAVPKPGLLAMAGRAMDRNDLEDFLKKQQSVIQDIEDSFKEFKSWLDSSGILQYYEELKKSYNANTSVEDKYDAYVRGNSPLKTPAGYRLAQYHPNLPKLSKVLDQYCTIADILVDDRRTTQILAKKTVNAKRIVELRKWLKDYQSKYLHPSDVKYLSATAPADVQQLSTRLENDIDNAEQQVQRLRDGFESYCTMMGIDVDKLRNKDDNGSVADSAKDMQKMAERVEGYLSALKEEDFAKALEKQTLALFSGKVDDQENPFVMNITTESNYLGCSMSTLADSLTKFTQKLITTDKMVRDAALNRGLIDQTTGAATGQSYFLDSAIPPEMDQLRNYTLGHQYCFDGYFGYWLQTILDKYSEITLCGADLVAKRYALLCRAKELSDAYLNKTKLSTVSDDLRTQQILFDPTAPNVNKAAIATALTKAITSTVVNNAIVTPITQEYAAKLAAGSPFTMALQTLRQNAPLLFSVCGKSNTIPGVSEVFLLRRTMLVISLLGAVATGTPFGPTTYTTDAFGVVPSTLFPQLDTATA